MNNIKIFACDHRHNVDWNLPYIRFGGVESDAGIKCENKIFDIEVNADETPKIYWLWKNLNEFQCDYIGYCQYRRFFTSLYVNLPVINIHSNQYQKQYALTPEQQLCLIQKNDVDGILHPAFNVINRNVTPFTYIWEQIYILEQEKNIQLKYQKFTFDLLLKYTPDFLKDYMKQSFKISENYLCNIFTCKSLIFSLFGSIAFKAVEELLTTMAYDEKKEIHPYWLAYVFERYTNCFFHSLELTCKYKFLKIPLMTIDADKHIEWKRK